MAPSLQIIGPMTTRRDEAARILTLTLAMTVIVPLTACTVVVGGDETACDLAVDHLATCGITTLPEIGECTPAKAQRASQLAATACADLGMRSSFTSSSCDSAWSIFNPSCWFDGDNEEGGEPEGDLPNEGHDPPPAMGAHTLFLNYNGGDIYKGANDHAPSNVATVVPHSIRIYPVSNFDLDQGDRDVVTSKVRAFFSEFGVNVVDRRPLHGPYTMVMFTPMALPNMPIQAVGVSPKDCGNKNPNNVIFVFTAPLLNALTFPKTHVATTIAHEVGHSYGLDHIKGWNAVMSPQAGELSEAFRSWKTGPVVSSNHVCSAGPTQDSRQVLRDNLR